MDGKACAARGQQEKFGGGSKMRGEKGSARCGYSASSVCTLACTPSPQVRGGVVLTPVQKCCITSPSIWGVVLLVCNSQSWLVVVLYLKL